MDNLAIYNKVRACPAEALKPIVGGKLKGKSDINPMWRIKTLTEQFGPCGIGWYPEIVSMWVEPGANGECVANMHIKLYVKIDGEWSKGREGVGGITITQTEKGKLVTNDEAFKMAYTDAISVACKLLGVAADVYWDNDRSKYDATPEQPAPPAYICADCGKSIKDCRAKDKVFLSQEIAAKSMKTYGRHLCFGCSQRAKEVLNHEPA